MDSGFPAVFYHLGRYSLARHSSPIVDGQSRPIPGTPGTPLPGSPLPEQFTALRWQVEKIGESQRVLPYAVTERFTIGGVEHPRHHVGIVAVDRYEIMGG